MMQVQKSFNSPKMNFTVIFAVLLLLSAIFFTTADMSCDSCGRECARACGTKHFRTCCFNYLRKRSAPLEVEQSINTLPQTPMDALISLDRKLETWIRDSKDLQDILHEAVTSQTVNNFKKKRLGTSEEMIELS